MVRQFTGPASIALDSQGNAYVVDLAFDEVPNPGFGGPFARLQAFNLLPLLGSA